ncbi:hypothetical protein H311_01874 [Anncaliia algerae PRA109]|nr:hypothetical protein H311_01874 [Anncaliia algerae PRA109]
MGKRVAKPISRESMQIGGHGMQVQLDESKFGKRRYNRDHHVEGAWVFVGVEKTPERQCFTIIVDKSDSLTLNQFIRIFVLPNP